MFNPLPVLLIDAYKAGHIFQYPDWTTMVYSNFTPRGSRIKGVDRVVAFGYQYFVKEYLQRQFNENFFARPKDQVVKQYKRRMDTYLGPGMSVDHIADLHSLGYLPLKVKAVPEGTLVPLRVPALTIRNTKPEFFWLTNSMETLLSNVLWQPSTSATTAFQYRKEFEKYAELTGASKDFIKWQGHDFSFRGMSGVEAALLSGAGHALSFCGSDTIPVADFFEQYYHADAEKELIIGSVAATEHSVMCMGLKDGEIKTIERLITQIYPKGIVSIVADTWDFWKFVMEYLPALKHVIMARDGKVVVRPDSGDPVKIICGDPDSPVEWVRKGAVQCLWDIFGGVVNAKGYKELDSHIGLIYGDSITQQRQQEILQRLAAAGFASSNIVLGIGSFTYQFATRDTYGWAMKATYGEIKGVGQEIFKKPATDDGIKNSAKGLLHVGDHDKQLYVMESCPWTGAECSEDNGELQTIFEDGADFNPQTLSGMRATLEAYL